jgi:phenylpropionate dioxygenase-like ring-hydroxylating dioxygenase large terminal subunit
MTTTIEVSPGPWQSMFERLARDMGKRDGAEWDPTESDLDPAIYHDRTIFEAEQAKLFRRLPLCLGHADQLRDAGSVLAREIAGVPLLMMRGRDDAIRVFLNVCRHRGARLVGEEGVACRRSGLSCHYHGWTYDLNGTLVGVPRREAFPTLDRASHGLRELPSAVHHGLIWAVLDHHQREMPDIAAFLGPIDGDLQALELGSHRFYRQRAVRRATNWKLIIDAFLEVYHVKRLHATTLGPFLEDTTYVADHVGPHQRILIARDTFAETRSLAMEEWSPRRHATLEHLIFPNSVLIQHPDYVSHLGMFPSAPGETLFVHTMLTPWEPRDEKEKAHWDRSFSLMDGDVFNGEDLFICEQIQLGFGAARPRDMLVLGRCENNLRRFHETVAAAIRA